MYYEHFGLDQPPFKITPDTRLFYEGGQRGEILDALLYAIESGEGMVKVVGEVGSGKTMLCRMLEVRLPETVEVVYLANPSLSPEDILHAIAFELKLPVDKNAGRLQVMQSLQEYLLEQHAQNRQVVLFVEEAQSMPLETLEEIRLLSNLETQQFKLLQIVLFGQPELDENLSLPHVRQLCERIVYNFDLEPFKGGEIDEYIDARLRASGYRGPKLFKPDAVKLIARESYGLTRRVNILADKSLLAAFAGESHEIKVGHVKRAVEDSQFGALNRRSPVRIAAWSAAAGVAAMGIVAVAWWQFSGVGKAGQPQPVAAPAAVQSSAPAAGERLPAESAGTLVAAETMPEEEPEPAALSIPPEAAPVAGAASPEVAVSVEPAAQQFAAIESVAQVAVVERVEAETEAGPEPAMPEAIPASGRRAELVAALPQDVIEPVPVEATGSATPETEGVVTEPAAEPPTLSGSMAPAPVQPVLGKLVEARLQATTDWLAGDRSGPYTIQILITSSASQDHLERFLAGSRKTGEYDKLYLYRTRITGVPMTGIVFNEYPTLSKAKEALRSLGPAMLQSRPFVRNIRDIDLLALTATE